MKQVSVIIPAHNEENYLKRTLESIKSQNYQNIEIIVVCNGCDDNTEQIAKTFANKVISLKMPNVSQARNDGVKVAEGEFLVLLVADTILHPEAISSSTTQLAKGSVYGRISGKSENKKYMPYTTTKNMISVFYAWSNGVIFCKKSDFLKTKGFNPNISHGELRQFYKEIKKYSTYKKISNVYAITSQRRIRKWGIKKILKFWIYGKNIHYKPIR
jgi:glycosyltransferase involved in cell wall biosynthesis